MVKLCESQEITPQIYLFLLKYASFHKKKFKIFAYSKKMLYFCSTKFQDIHNKDFIPMCKHSRGERESELLFFPLKGEYPKSPFKGDLEGLEI